MQQRQAEEPGGAKRQRTSPVGVVVHVAATDCIGPMCVDQLAAAVERSPSAFLGTATGSTPHKVGFWKDLQHA